MRLINKLFPGAIDTLANRNISYTQVGKDFYNQFIWHTGYILAIIIYFLTFMDGLSVCFQMARELSLFGGGEG